MALGIGEAVRDSIPCTADLDIDNLVVADFTNSAILFENYFSTTSCAQYANYAVHTPFNGEYSRTDALSHDYPVIIVQNYQYLSSFTINTRWYSMVTSRSSSRQEDSLHTRQDINSLIV